MRLGLRGKNKIYVRLTEIEKPDLWGCGVERQPLNPRTGPVGSLQRRRGQRWRLQLVCSPKDEKIYKNPFVEFGGKTAR